MNRYLTELETYLHGKYKKYIIDLISKRLLNIPNDVYTELHHIIPRSWGGIDNKENLVTLTAREHFLIHAMLPKACIGEKKSKMIYAFINLSNAKTKDQKRYSSKIYSYKQGSLKLSKETREKISETTLSNLDEIEKRRQRMINLNKKNNAERNKRQGQKLIKICEVCNASIHGGNMNVKQHNCKKHLKKQEIQKILSFYNFSYPQKTIICPECNKSISTMGNIFTHLKKHYEVTCI